MLLPSADRAVIDIRKLRDYCLSQSHPVGKHKAIVFRSALGLTDQDAERLRDLLLQEILSCEATESRSDEFGRRFQVDVPLTTAAGAATVRTAWIVRSEEDFPRLTTCYIFGSTMP